MIFMDKGELINDYECKEYEKVMYILQFKKDIFDEWQQYDRAFAHLNDVYRSYKKLLRRKEIEKSKIKCRVVKRTVTTIIKTQDETIKI